MARYILRYRGTGSHAASDLDRALARRSARVIDRTSNMVLVEGTADALHAEFDGDPNWLIVPERAIQRPDPRPRIQRKR